LVPLAPMEPKERVTQPYSPAHAAAVVPQINGIGRPCMETGSGVVVG
jgi:hypothetical protein